MSELQEEFEGLSASQKEELRQSAKTDLYFLCKGVLGYDQLRVDAHAPLCAFLQFEPSPRKQVLMPRGHLKSTIGTVGRATQLAIRDPSGYRCLILNAVERKAESFLGQIKGHWQKQGGLLPQLFPELVPKKFAGPGSDWSSLQASLRPARNFKEPTWMAMGAGSGASAFHFSHIIPDDIIDERHKASTTEMNRVIEWNHSIESLLDTPEKDEICWIGTRKTLTDVYADNKEVYPNLVEFVREPIENGEPIFPFKFSIEWFMNKMEKFPEEWAHDYMNNPIGKGGIDWGEGVLRTFMLTEGESVVFYDPISQKARKWRLADLDIVMTVDPNSGKPHAPDQAAVCVQGNSPEGDVFVLSSRSGRPSPQGLVEWIWADACKWKPRVIGIEEAGQQSTHFWFDKYCEEHNRYFNVVDLKHGNRNKEERIRKALDTPFKEQKIYFLATQIVLRSQVKMFPQLAAHNWDEIDALSYGPELWLRGITEEVVNRRIAAQNRILAARGITGYGRSYRR